MILLHPGIETCFLSPLPFHDGDLVFFLRTVLTSHHVLGLHDPSNELDHFDRGNEQKVSWVDLFVWYMILDVDSHHHNYKQITLSSLYPLTRLLYQQHISLYDTNISHQKHDQLYHQTYQLQIFWDNSNTKLMKSNKHWLLLSDELIFMAIHGPEMESIIVLYWNHDFLWSKVSSANTKIIPRFE